MDFLQDERLRATPPPSGNESAAKVTRAYLTQKVRVCFYLPKICYFAPKQLFVNAVPIRSNGRAKVPTRPSSPARGMGRFGGQAGA
jgi:hypothetical protein